MTPLPNRRHFLVRFLAMLVRRKEVDSAVTYFGHDAVLIECRGLHCGIGRQADGTWELAFAVYRTTKTWGGTTVERIMPLPTLRKKLLKLGISTEYDGPSLVAHSEVPVDPGELLGKMKTLLTAVDR